MFLNLFKSFKGLTKYSCGTGGDMIGSSHAISVVAVDDTHALITVSSAKSWNLDSETIEYMVERHVLKEIETIFHKYGMKMWNPKKMQLFFVADGANTSYSFEFGEKRIHFSSQSYPKQYGKKLSAIDEALKKYMQEEARIPGFQTEITEECQNWLNPDDGAVRVKVFGYAEKRLNFRILNGTDHEINIPKKFVLENAQNGEIIATKESDYVMTISEHSYEEAGLKLPDFLKAGAYRLKVQELSADFSIS